MNKGWSNHLNIYECLQRAIKWYNVSLIAKIIYYIVMMQFLHHLSIIDAFGKKDSKS